MPKATTNINDVQRFELTSCPEGFVVLRRMNYGEMLERRAFTGKLALKMGQGSDTEGYLQMANRLVTEFEFRNCIVDHNLTDDNDVALDFRKATTLNTLDPRIGDEISGYIDTMNQNVINTESLGNSKNGSLPASL